MRRAQWVAAAGAAVSILLVAGVPAAQPPAPSQPGPAQPAPVPTGPTQPAPVPTTPTPPGAPTPTTPEKEEEREEPEVAPRPTITIPQQRVPEEIFPTTRATTFIGPDLFNPPPHRGFITVTPKFTLSGEYNDNIHFTSQDRRSDGIFGFSPGVTLTLQQRGFQLATGLTTTGQVFVNESDLSGFGKQLQFFADLFYQVSPRVTLVASDRMYYDRNSSGLTTGGVSVGFEQGLRNTLTSTVRFQATPNTGLSVTGSHTIITFPEASGSSAAQDSNTYRLDLGADHRFTQRLSGGLTLGVAYIDIERETPAWTFTPAPSVAYDITRSLKGYLTAGPTLVTRDGDTTLASAPSMAAGLLQTFKFGSLSVGYDRAATAETIGSSDRQAFFGSLVASTLVRGLVLAFTPRYTIVDTDVVGSPGGETLHTLTFTLNATYQIARNISLFGSYTYYRETSDRPGAGAIDQNRVFLGVQYAFPITIY